jgi:hypothetical protein
VATDAQTAGAIWLAYPFGYPLVSFDGGNTFLQAGFSQFLGTAVAVDPTNSSNVFYGTASGGLLMSINGGRPFSLITICGAGCQPAADCHFDDRSRQFPPAAMPGFRECSGW